MKTMKKIIVLVVCAPLFLDGPYVFGETPKIAPQEQTEISLKDAILIAFKNNKDLQREEKGMQVAKANILDARSRFLPHVDLDYSYTHNDKVLAENIFSGYSNDNQAGLSLNQSIYKGGANIANFRQAMLGLKVEEETIRAKKLDIEFEAKRLYYGLLYAYETERIARELVTQAEAHYLDVESKYRHGTSSRIDLLQSKVQVSLLKPQLVKARNDIESIKAELNNLLGRKVDIPIKAKEKLEYTPIEIKEKEFLSTAYLNKPELILKTLGVDLNRWSVEMAKAGYRPDINLQAEYGYRSNDLGSIVKDKQRNWNIGLGVTMPIFEGFSTKAKVDASRAQYAQAVLDRENLSDQIAVDIRNACLNLKQAETIIISQKDNVEEAREALRISEVSYDNGVAVNLDVLDAQVSLAQIQNNLAGGIYDYLMAMASLDRTMAQSYIREEIHEK